MKKIFFLVILYSILTTESYSQWWVDGGNLIWPYGDVSITNGNLNLSGDFKFEGDQHITVNDSVIFKDSENKIGIITGSASGGLSVKFGDLDEVSEGNYFLLDDFEFKTNSIVTSTLVVTSLKTIHNVSNPPIASELSVFSSLDNGVFILIDDSDSNNYFMIYKLSVGFLYFPMSLAQ